MQVVAGSSGTTAFSAGNESSGSLSGGMTNPRLLIRPISGSDAGEVEVSGRLNVAVDPVDGSKNNSGALNVVGDTTLQDLDIGGTIKSSVTVDEGASETQVNIHSSTGNARLNIDTDASGGAKYASIEMGGTDGAFIDIKEPMSDDFDLRIEHGVASNNQSLIRSKHPLVIQTDISGGEGTIKREGSPKLATSAAGIDVTGTITADGLVLGDGEFSLLNGNLKIQSISNNSFIDHIDTNSSKLFVRAEGATHIKSITNDKLQASFADSEVSLWYDDSKVLATESGGINVTGTVTADGLTVDGSTTLNTGATANGVLIDGTGGGTGLKIRTSETATLASPDLTFTRTGNRIVGGATNIGQMHFDAKNSNSGNSTFAEILGRAEDYTENDEDGSLLFRPSVAGTLTTILNVDKNGIDVTGTVTADALTMGDNEKITLGAGSDFEIYHDPDHSIIKESNASGNLKIQAQNINIQNAAGSKNFIHTDSNVDVRLSYDGNTRLTTTTGGVFIAGAVQVGAQGTTTGGQITFREGTDNGTNTTILQAPADAGSGMTINLPSSAGTLALTSEIPTVPASGISNGNVATFTSGVADDDFLRVSGTSIEGLSDTELKSALSLAKGDVGLGNVENKSSATIRGEIVSGNIPTLNQDTTGNAATATIAKGAAEVVSSSATTGHATVAGYVGKTVIYTASSGDLTLGVPQCTEDLAVGEQIHFVNAATNSSSKIILDINEGHSDTQTISICTGATVTAESSADPHIVQGGVATLIAVSANNYVLFGSGVVDN